MSKWFDKLGNGKSSIIYSRLRLTRNWDKYVFPSRLSEEENRLVVNSLREGLKDLGQFDGHQYQYIALEAAGQPEKLALRERRILNQSALEREGAGGLYLSEDESRSLLLGVDDHIRIQLLAPGLTLESLWKKADKIDDYVNERFSYAFDEKYGYLTSFPTNVGTGLRACVVMHLPGLSQVKKFQSIVGDMSRFGASIKGLFGEGDDNYGNLYEISNQRTLGLSEKEIVELVTKAAMQLNNQEMRVRAAALETKGAEREDEAYKSYGVLKYARRITQKDARIFLSQLMAGEADGLMGFESQGSIYRMLMGIKPANLTLWARRPLRKEEMDTVRASYIRQSLPDIEASASETT